MPATSPSSIGDAADGGPPVTEAAVRSLYRSSFDRLNDRLVDTKFDRFLRFLNFGYAPLPGEPLAGPVLPKRFPNLDSAQLLFQTIDGIGVAGKRVLEVGCGRGGNIGLLIDYLDVDSAVGVDLALSNMAWCNKAYQGRPARFVQTDAEAIPLMAESIPVVVNIESSGCYPDVEKFFREVARVLEVGGVLCWADLARREMVEAYRNVLPALGLRLRRDRDITENVLASRQARAERQQLVFGDGAKLDGMGDWVGVDGSSLHDELADPECCYQIQQWEKVERVEVGPEPLFDGHQLELILRFSARGASILGDTTTSRPSA